MQSSTVMRGNIAGAGEGNPEGGILSGAILTQPIPDDRLSRKALVSESLLLCEYRLPLSKWSASGWKRFFDCVFVLLALPLVLPLLVMTALLVRLTSRGPVFFVQRRVGQHGRTFTIFKFRSMVIEGHRKRDAVATANSKVFTPIGPFLRRFKLDELPQVFNVLMGHMSLVGPRPKMAEHVTHDLPCRPGITGCATLAFAREEMAFVRIPREEVDAFYHDVVLPVKHEMDENYMSEASLTSDLVLLLKTVFRQWDATMLIRLVDERLKQNSAEEKRSPVLHEQLISLGLSSVYVRYNLRLSALPEDAGNQ